MKKNVTGQKIGVQMVSATDGSAFTGSVTVSVTGDAGTQATGSVGAGACVHEGNGYHTYAPAQAETNYDLIAFTFTGSGAVPATVQVYSLPTTGILAPSVADRTIVVDGSGTVGRVTLVDTTTTNTDMITAAGVRTAVGLASANLDTQLSTIDDFLDTEIATIISNIAALNNVSTAQVITSVTTALTTALTEGYRSTNSTGSVRDLLYELISHMGESSISSTTKTLKKIDGSTTAKTYTLDSSTTPTSITETT